MLRGALRVVAGAAGVCLLAGAAIAQPVALRDLLTAARRGDVPGVQRALAAGADVDAADPTYAQTALMRAALFAQAGVTRALLTAKARTNLVSNGGRTALHWAAVGGSGEVVTLLAGANATVDAGDAYDETPLGTAVAEGTADAVAALLAAGARGDRMKRSLADHLSLVLGNDMEGGRLEAVRLVIRARQAIESRSVNESYTPLQVAAEQAHHRHAAAIVRELLAAGATTAVRNREGRPPEDEVRVRLTSHPAASLVTNLQATLAAFERSRAR